MSLAVHVADALHEVTGLSVRRSGALKPVTEAWVRTSGALKLLFETLKISLSEYDAYGYINSSYSTSAISEPVTATVEGAVGAVTYAWTRVAADAHIWTIFGADQATAKFETHANPGEVWTATFKCTATDSAGQVIDSGVVTVTNENLYFGGYP